MRKVFTVFVALIVLTACSGEENQSDYLFTGESEHWEAEYSVRGMEVREEENGEVTYSNEYSDTFEITYKGTLEELSSLESLEYSFETSAGSGSGRREFDEPPREVSFKSGGGGSGPKVNEDEIIQVKVTWSFELYNEDS